MCRKRIQRQNQNVPGAREEDRLRGRREREGEEERRRTADSRSSSKLEKSERTAGTSENLLGACAARLT